MTILATMQAIANPTRFEILHLVRGRELAAGDIARHFDTTRPAVSQHLRVLHRAGLLQERRKGTTRFYSVRPEGFEQLPAFFEGFWDLRLRHLKLAAEATERSQRRKKSDGRG